MVGDGINFAVVPPRSTAAMSLENGSRLEEELRADVRTPVELDFRTGAALNVHERHEVVGDVVVGADREFELPSMSPRKSRRADTRT